MEENCMKANYDFSDAVKNPFAGMINGKYTVTIHYDFTKQDGCEEYKNATALENNQFKEECGKYGK